jgi:hypothetical protein
MKKATFLLVFTMIVGTYFTHAQGEKSNDKVGGIRAGWHYAAMVKDGSKPDTANNLNSFYLGFYRDNRLARIIYFGSGLEYFQNGLKYTDNSKRVLHTLSIPLDLKVKLGPVFALGGIAANFKVSEKLVVGDNKYDPAENQKSHWFDAPVFLGAGVKIFFITVEARYHWGIIEARNDYYNHYFQLGLGLSF